MPISINPFTGERISRYEEMDVQLLEKRIADNFKRWKEYRFSHLNERVQMLQKLRKLLGEQKNELALLISTEMGKPIRQSIAEIEKCQWLCDYYAENAIHFLSDEVISTDASDSRVVFEPIGPILAVMPWNFPFWQVFRFAAPALVAGNSCVLKHASNVTTCALAMEKLFDEAGFNGLFSVLICTSDKVSHIIENQNIKAVTLTGSESAGRSVAAAAGRCLKKSVLELGGSNSFIVDPSADLVKAVETGVAARYQNNGQSCIAAKRFLVHKSIYDEFTDAFCEKVRGLRHGDPLDPDTDIGPLAKESFNNELRHQVEESVKMGAECILGGVMNGRIFEAGVLQHVTPGMPAFEEETFGPIAAFTAYDSTEDAVRLHESSRFGLGLSIFTSKPEEWSKEARMFSDGAVFFNEMVKSDPRLPFGGQKSSGYGRELAKDGLMEFINRKLIYTT